MHDSLQQGLQNLAMQNGVTREVAVLCAAVAIYILGAEWLLTVAWRRTHLTIAMAARILLIALGAYVASKVLGSLISDPRPYIVAHARPLIPVARDNGFPSDHVLLAALLTSSLWWLDRRLMPLFALGTVLVMLGRLGIGAHHTLDVVGSAVIVLIVMLAVCALPLPAAWDRLLMTVPSRHQRRSDQTENESSSDEIGV